MQLSQFKQGFFDTQLVIKSLDKATRQAFSKWGAFVRQRAKTSIRKRKEVSKPGASPSSHTDDLKKRILFAYDPNTRAVVVGPTLFNHRRIPTVPEILEFGGNATVKGEVKHYHERPFMRPAAATENRNLGGLLKDTMR